MNDEKETGFGASRLFPQHAARRSTCRQVNKRMECQSIFVTRRRNAWAKTQRSLALSQSDHLFEQWRDRCLEEEKIEFEHLTLPGNPVDVINEFAETFHIDVIVMGTHGRTGLTRVFLGSVAQGVLRRAPCAVITIKVPDRLEK